MNGTGVNSAIDRIVRDRAFHEEVRTRGEVALDAYKLSPPDAEAIVAAVDTDATARSGAPFVALRRLARFEPLFASYSATSTKKG